MHRDPPVCTVTLEPAGMFSVADFSAGVALAVGVGALVTCGAIMGLGSQPSSAATPVRLSRVTEAAATRIIGWVLGDWFSMPWISWKKIAV